MSKNSHSQDDDGKRDQLVQSDSVQSEGETRRAPVGARGKRRWTLILDTAADLLNEGGPEAINTNALAERAGIAVGSVYQYFSNKEAVLAALGERYLVELRGNTVTALQQDLSGLTISEIVDRVIDPMVAFERRHPAFGRLIAGHDHGGTLARSASRIDREILATIHTFLTTISPISDEPSAWRTAKVTKALYKGISYLIQSEDRTEDGTSLNGVDDLIADMKGAIAVYIAERLELRLDENE